MLRVFGTVEVGGVPVRSAAQRRILAALVLDLGQAVTVDRLAELVWGADPPGNPAASLQNHVSRLRRLLGPEFSVAAIGSSYRLDVALDRVDVKRFEEAFREVCANPEDLESIEAALAICDGRPYADLDDSRSIAEVARLEEMHAALRELRAAEQLRSGRLAEAIAALEVLCHEFPLRERPVELLMLAHVEAGRTSDALAAFRRLRSALVDELGLDPSPRLRDLESAILTEKHVAARDRSREPAVVQEPAAEPRSPAVPVPTSSFVGRAAMLQRVQALVDAYRIVTIVGPGGVGKTRLSLHAAAALEGRFTGVTVVELSTLREAGQVGEMIAGTLGLRPSAGDSDAQRIIDGVGRRRHLLVLDNCEHVLEAVRELVEEVAPTVPNLVWLSTSREPLRVAGEHVVRLDPLEIVGPAVDLFLARAEAACGVDQASDPTLTPVVERICRALDGLPLAIELAAGRSGSMSLHDLAATLEDPLTLRRRRGAQDRHGSLRALVEWSVDKLDAELADVFARCSVFAGPFTAVAAAEVTGLPHGSIAAGLADLAERSLLGVVPDTGPRSTYRFLETIRAFAAAELRSRPDTDVTADRHADWVLALVERSRDSLMDWPGSDSDVGQPDAEVLSRLAEVRVAHLRFLQSGDLDRAVRLASALHFTALFHMQPELFRWIRDTAERFVDADHPLVEDVLASASIGSWQSGDLDGAERFARRALAASRRSEGSEAGRGAAEAMADVIQFGGDNLAGLRHFESALAIARAAGNRLHTVTNLADAAMVAGYLGEVGRVRDLISQADRELGDGGAPVLRAWVRYAEGEALAEHDPDAALEALRVSLELAERAGAAFIIGVAGLTRTGLQVRSGQPEAALEGLVPLVEHWRRAGAWVQQWITQRTVVEVLLARGDHHHAGLVLGAVLGAGVGTEASGPDAARLDRARTELGAHLPDVQGVLDRGARIDRDELIDLVLVRLTAG